MVNSYITDENAFSNGLTAQHISANLEKYEAARSGFFTLVVDDIDSISRAAYGGRDEIIPGAQQSIMLSVTKTSVPHFTVEVLRYRRGNEEVKFAGVPTFGEGSLVIDDMLGLETKNLLMAWQGLAYNIKTRKGGRMKDYKKTCTLCEYTQDYELIRSWTLFGCWISDVSEEDFDKENDGKRQIQAKLQYDRAELV